MDKLLSGRRILVVEDEMLLLLMLEDLIADLGCESVTAASSVDTAIRLIDGQIFDAAVLDMNLNGNSSRPVADALAAHGVPFIFSTGHSTFDLSDGYGDRPMLKKPFQYEELVEGFTRLLPRCSKDSSHCGEPLPG